MKVTINGHSPSSGDYETEDFSVSLYLSDDYKLTVWDDGNYMLTQKVGDTTHLHSKVVAHGARGSVVEHLILGKNVHD